MTLDFSKYHGTGNDFILIDNFNGQVDLSLDQIRHLCSRHTGIGSDGLILIEKSENADFNMNFYNPDGSQSYCGNGSRCAHAFAIKQGLVENSCTFEAIDGVHESEFDNNVYKISLTDVKEIEAIGDDLLLNTGSPHYITQRQRLHELRLIEEARMIRYNERFAKNGVNVNFIAVDAGAVSMRTYERGVEGETLSCGTGVTAAGIASHHLGLSESPVPITAPGGNLKVYFDFSSEGYSNVRLEGPVTHVFDGQIEL